MTMGSGAKILLVSGKSGIKETASSIVRSYEEGNHNIEIRAIGASSVNQMVKALATAASFFAMKGYDMTVRHGYDMTLIDGEEKTVIVSRIIVK